MTTGIDLKNIEKKVWTSYFEDGFWDIFMGLLMLSLGINILTDESAIGYALLALAVVLGPVGRRFITYPRIGRVKFGPLRQVKRRKIMFIVIVCVVLGLFGWIMGATGSNPDIEAPDAITGLIFGIAFLAIFGSMAYFMDFKRMYAYGLLLAISMALTESLDNSVGPIVMCASGAATTSIGFAITACFIRKYPKLAREDMNGHA